MSHNKTKYCVNKCQEEMRHKQNLNELINAYSKGDYYVKRSKDQKGKRNKQFKVKESRNNALFYVKKLPHPPFWRDVMLWIISRSMNYSNIFYPSDRQVSTLPRS